MMWSLDNDLGGRGLMEGQLDLGAEFPGEYGFVKSAPQSPESNNSFSIDPMEVTSDEDFLTQLSNDLDIPLLLNQEDDNGYLSSYLDKTPDEILSEISSPSRSSNQDFNDIPLDFLNFEVDLTMSPKSEPLSDESSNGESPRSLSRGSISPVKSESPNSKSFSNNSLQNSWKRTTVKNFQVVPNKIQKPTIKTETKNVPIQPKMENKLITPTIAPVVNGFNGNSVVFIKNELPQILKTNNVNKKVVVLSNQTIVPVTTINTATTTISHAKNSISQPVVIKNNNLLNLNLENRNIDPKIFKKHQRKIKNRESACLSRKKKKDYLNSLEDKVQELTLENETLATENAALKERLSLYENISFDKKFPGIQGKNAKLALCVFLLVVGFNLDFLRRPFSFRTDIRNFKPLQEIPDHHSRSLLWALDDGGGEPVKNNTEERRNSSLNYFTMCPVSINQTESARLVLELEKWIGKPIAPPLTKKNYSTFKEETPYQRKKNHLKKLNKKKIRVDSLIAPLSNYGPENHKSNEIQVFAPTSEQLYSEFFEAINRRDDTFYVVSFNQHHMLLPALYHNKTRRPKMSFLMPNPMINDTSSQNFVPLMQIDCEVLDTKLVNVKYGSIPTQYRNGNVTETNMNQSTQNVKTDNTSAGTDQYEKKPYKPYFLYKKLSKSEEHNKYHNLTADLDFVKP